MGGHGATPGDLHERFPETYHEPQQVYPDCATGSWVEQGYSIPLLGG